MKGTKINSYKPVLWLFYEPMFFKKHQQVQKQLTQVSIFAAYGYTYRFFTFIVLGLFEKLHETGLYFLALAS